MNQTYPIVYKQIPVQFAFHVSTDGVLQIRQLTKIDGVKKFKDEKEARQFIEDYEVIL